jgi:hypothetical protein
MDGFELVHHLSYDGEEGKRRLDTDRWIDPLEITFFEFKLQPETSIPCVTLCIPVRTGAWGPAFNNFRCQAKQSCLVGHLVHRHSNGAQRTIGISRSYSKDIR